MAEGERCDMEKIPLYKAVCIWAVLKYRYKHLFKAEPCCLSSYIDIVAPSFRRKRASSTL